MPHWLAQQAQNWVSQSDDIGGTLWTKNCNNVPVRADDLALPSGRKLQGWFMGVNSFFSSIGCLVTNSNGLWTQSGQTAFLEFATYTSSKFGFSLYDPSSAQNHVVDVYVDLVNGRVNSIATPQAAVYSAGYYERGHSTDGKRIYVLWLQITSQFGVGNTRQLFIYPEVTTTVASLSPASYGIFIGHVQVMDGLVDPRSVPWVVTCGAPINVGSFSGAGLPAAVMMEEDGLREISKPLMSEHRTENGAQFKYRWGEQGVWEVPLNFVSSADALRINSWWGGNQKLLYIDDDNFKCNSVQLMNQRQPFALYERGRLEHQRGVLRLETY